MGSQAVRSQSLELLTVKMAAEVLQLPTKSVYELVQGGMPHYRIGRRVRIPARELAEWVESQRAEQ